MADYCKQCAEELGLSNDFAGITSESAWQEGYAVVVLCEGCGPIQVDPDGNCVSENCLAAEEGRPHHKPWIIDTGEDR
jgi:RNase P subunit RPR2